MINRLFISFALFLISFTGSCQSGEKYRILYVFPHPDDESYGPAAVIDKNVKAGHEVHLLTLTKGGATRVRHELNLSVEEMGEVRYKEMQEVNKVLRFTSMAVHDLPDGGLKERDPREIENIIKEHIIKLKPNVLVTYPVHGISAHNDHIVTHAALKRVFLELKDSQPNLMRLAFFHATDEDNEIVPTTNYKTIKEDEIDCIVEFSPDNVETAHRSLDCYTTYGPLIEQSNIKKAFTKSLTFDFYMEKFDEPVKSLTDKLNGNQ